jgi:hypothetical protein
MISVCYRLPRVLSARLTADSRPLTTEPADKFELPSNYTALESGNFQSTDVVSYRPGRPKRSGAKRRKYVHFHFAHGLSPRGGIPLPLSGIEGAQPPQGIGWKRFEPARWPNSLKALLVCSLTPDPTNVDDVVVERVRAFSASSKDDASLLKTFDVSEKKGWRARRELKQVDISKAVIKTNYRPFDSRWIFFNSTLVWGRSWPTMQHVVGHRRNPIPERSGISKPTIGRLESIDSNEPIGGRPETSAALITALEKAGVEFIDENGGGTGVRMKRRGKR